jgi:hypothetical protein
MGKKEELVWKYLLQNPTADAEEVARETQVSYMHVKKCMNKIGTPKEVLASIEPLPKELASRLTNGKAQDEEEKIDPRDWVAQANKAKGIPSKKKEWEKVEEEFEIEELFKDVDDEWLDGNKDGGHDDLPSYHRQDVLLKAGNLIDGDRHEEYGEAKDNFALIAKYWNGHLGLVDFITVRDVAMMMALMKIARTHGDGRKSRDTFVDICGYAALAGEINEDG